jgi:sulfite exporter TauE/SafE/plastocyanin
VVTANASAARGRVVVVSNRPLDHAAVSEAVHEAGYRVGTAAWVSRDRATWATFGIAAVLVVVAGGALGGVSGRLPGLLVDPSSAGLVLFAALGLAAGVSTCMALVGGLVLAIGATALSKRGEATGSASAWGLMRSQVPFHVGRLVGFAGFGAALGAVGARVALPPLAVAALTLVAAAVMVLLGVRLTGISPRLAAWVPHLPERWSELPGRVGLTPAVGPWGIAAAGAATFFVPCGFTQAVQVYALSTRSPTQAALVMGVFALGTMPGLLALAELPAVGVNRFGGVPLRVLGVVVLGFAALNAVLALQLSGAGRFTGTSRPPVTVQAEPGPSVTVTAVDQTLRSVQDASGYRPGNAVVYAGLPIHWVVASQEPYSCAISMESADLGVRTVLRPGENRIELPALEPGTYRYACTMGMYRGTITVVPRPA